MSRTWRWTGWSSSWCVLDTKTDDSRSKVDDAVRLRIGDRLALSRRARSPRGRACRDRACRTARSRACWSTCRSRPAAMPASVPNFDHSGLTLRTGLRSRPISERAPRVFVARQFVVGAAGGDRRGDMLRGQHAGQDRVVAALDARHVDEAGRAADQRAAREDKLRHRLPAAFGDGARAVGQTPCRPRAADAISGWVLKRWNSSNGDRYGLA